MNFKIYKAGGETVIAWNEGGVRVAQATEVAMWSRIQALQAWIDEHGEHADGCTGFLAKIEDDGSETDLPCTCGLAALVEAH